MVYTVEVVDQDGNPVPNVDVGSSVFEGRKATPSGGKNVYDSIKVRTNSDGLAEFDRKSADSLMNYFVHVPRQSYYYNGGYRFTFKKPVDGVWQPENKRFRVVVKKVLDPIPMYAKKGPHSMPGEDRDVGYDLEIGDWVSPHGKGKRTDLLFHFKLDATSPTDSSSELTVSFPNAKDGLIPFEAEPFEGSILEAIRKP